MGETEREGSDHCPGYDFGEAVIRRLECGIRADEIRVMECPNCGEMTYVMEIKNPPCLCCGHSLKNHLDEVISLAEYWERLLSEDVLWTGGEA